MRKIEGSVNEPIETTAKRVWTWRDYLGFCLPGAVQAVIGSLVVVMNLVFDALTPSLAVAWFAFYLCWFIGNDVWWRRCRDDLYRKYPPRSGTRYVPSRSLTASTISGPQCPAGIAAPSAIQ